MPISLLRRPSRPREPSVAPAIGAISLPDLTGPLSDTTAWSVPHSAVDGGKYPEPLAGAGSPTSPNSDYSHSPDGHSSAGHHSFASPLTAPSRVPARVRDVNGKPVTDFHRPFRSVSPQSPPSLGPRSRKNRRLAALTIMVVGPSGSGKTSFIDALTGVMDPELPRLGKQGIRAPPTTSVMRHEIMSARERRSLLVLDTPGLPLPEAGTARRGRALNALLGIVEDRLAHHLSEESKVVRRKADGADLVTLIIYVVDARTVLVKPPTIDIDWDTIAEPPAKGPRPTSRLEPHVGEVEARFPVEDIEAIRRFSVRANVLPVLTHADALTTRELAAVRAAVVRDLTTVFGRDPLGAWGILSASPGPEEADEEEDPEHPERASMAEKSPVPYAVFAPEVGVDTGFTRAFRWGSAAADDAAHSDLPAVRDALMSAAEWLRMSTREGVYEKFRTEKLLCARGVKAEL